MSSLLYGGWTFGLEESIVQKSISYNLMISSGLCDAKWCNACIHLLRAWANAQNRALLIKSAIAIEIAVWVSTNGPTIFLVVVCDKASCSLPAFIHSRGVELHFVRSFGIKLRLVVAELSHHPLGRMFTARRMKYLSALFAGFFYRKPSFNGCSRGQSH